MGHVLAHLISAETKRAHRATWFVYGGPYGEKIRLRSSQKHYGMGYDVTCSCGWESSTGGATRRSVEDLLWNHRHLMQANNENSRPSQGVLMARVTRLLTDASFGDCLTENEPGGDGVIVTTSGLGAAERPRVLADCAAALEAAGLTVEQRETTLHVTQEKESGEA